MRSGLGLRFVRELEQGKETVRMDKVNAALALFDMEVGEVRMVSSDYGIHVMMRYELDEGAYQNEENEYSFLNQQTGLYSFMDSLINQVYASYLQPYAERVAVYEDRLTGVDMKSVNANSSY